MSKPSELAGRRFGRLVAKERSGSNANGRALWLCLCDCGGTHVVLARELLGGKVKSCGCYHGDALRERAAAIRSGSRARAAEIKVLVHGCLMGAKSKGFAMELSSEEVADLSSSDCFYCGAAPSRRMKNYVHDSGLRWNGIDRIDSSIGYVFGNCVPCCTTCNLRKSNANYFEFIEWIQRASLHIKSTTVDLRDNLVLRLSPQEAADYVGATLLERAA